MHTETSRRVKPRAVILAPEEATVKLLLQAKRPLRHGEQRRAHPRPALGGAAIDRAPKLVGIVPSLAVLIAFGLGMCKKRQASLSVD